MFLFTVAVLAVAIYIFISWQNKKFGVLKELGIPGPEPTFIFGNILELIKKNPNECHKEWIQKYGRITGFYIFTIPVVLVADTEILKTIQISEFHKFINRPFTSTSHQGLKGGECYLQMTNLRDKRWKEIRSILTPSFTTSKMRSMSPLIHGAINTLIESIEQKVLNLEMFNIYPLYQKLTLDAIGRAAFGVQTENRNEDSRLLNAFKVMVSGGFTSYLLLITVSFPGSGKVLRAIAILLARIVNEGRNPIADMFDTVKNVIKMRRQGKTKRQDLLQLMMDAEMSESDLKKVSSADLTAEDDIAETKKGSKTSVGTELMRRMTDDEILDNAALFFAAGYETTSTALAFITHFLTHFPEIQEKLRKEVKLAESEGELDYGAVQKMQYMDQVIWEALRIYPPITLFVNREAGEDYDFGSFRVKKGMNIQVPVFNIHHDPKYWPDSETFDPERFSPEQKKNNDPLAFQVFGAGPRNCVGMRFAQMEIKLVLARLLQKFRLEPCEKTDKLHLKLRVTPVTNTPGKGVYLRAVPLQS